MWLSSRVITGTAILLFGLSGAMFADDDDWRRNRRNDRDRYRNDDYRYRNDDYRYRNDDYRYRGRGGYGMNSSSIVDRVHADLSATAARNRLDSHERNHIRQAQQELRNFESDLRDGKFDRGDLKNAIEHLSDLARADQVHPRDRQRLAEDIQLLSHLRDSGEYYGRNRW